MAQIYDTKKDDRVNRKYGRKVEIHLSVNVPPLHSGVKVGDEFKPLAGRLLAHAQGVVFRAMLQDSVHVGPRLQ